MFAAARTRTTTAAPKRAASFAVVFAMGAIAAILTHHSVTDAAARAPADAEIVATPWASTNEILATLDIGTEAEIEAVAANLFDMRHVEGLLAYGDAETAGDLMEILYHPALMSNLSDGVEVRRAMWNAAADAVEALFEQGA